MQANSRPVTSSQTAPHVQLGRLITRHVENRFLKPVTAYNQAAFDTFLRHWQAAGSAPLILDAGCGVGLSTYHLAQQWPDSFVLGVDQSADRIDRQTIWSGPPPPNALLLRADLADFWRLMLESKLTLSRHYLLYPNPWPKIGHLSRRWHGHPAFPAAVALGGVIECRSNWPIYIEECALALQLLNVPDVVVEPFRPDTPITPFESKYLASGHVLWRCRSHALQAADTR
ncbi:SAM-dependent methyltransferase [Actimicrobium antarcticum]|uniref:tRNA (guanine(46)-N(7))-methyltransferase n=1 Tax=Actimicrobium antarcticum TaxID=1051899 RepID=A0ABP7T5X5_9BURK